MHDLHLLLQLETTMRPTKIIPPYREPTHPAVIPRRFREGARLAHLALIAQATGPVLTLHDTRLDDFIAEQIQDMLQTHLAMHDPRS